MKIELSYQASEYDCGPTTLLNAIRYLFDREEILPEILRAISLYTLDLYDKDGEYGKSGTSPMAMRFLSNWFNQFGETKNFPIYTEILQRDNVHLSPNCKITECLQQGGIAIVCVWLGTCMHYILLTDLDTDSLYVFDPYEWDEPLNAGRITRVEGYPKKMNRKVKMRILNEENHDFYALGEIKNREAMLLYNTNVRKTPEKSIEYFI